MVLLQSGLYFNDYCKLPRQYLSYFITLPVIFYVFNNQTLHHISYAKTTLLLSVYIVKLLCRDIFKTNLFVHHQQ